MAGSSDADRLAADLARLGVREGGFLVVHASYRALGPVDGGPGTVIEALGRAVGPEGTLAMPGFRDGVSLPGLHASVPGSVIERARAATPLYDPSTTPTTMGAIAETFRTSGALRSAHPTASYLARGPGAAWLVDPHPLPFATGDGSPQARLAEVDAQHLMLGVGFDRLSLLHLAEARVPHGRRKTQILPTPGGVVLAHDAGDDLGVHFPEIGRRALAAGIVRRGTVGEATAMLVDAQSMLWLAVAYLTKALSPSALPAALPAD